MSNHWYVRISLDHIMNFYIKQKLKSKQSKNIEN